MPVSIIRSPRTRKISRTNLITNPSSEVNSDGYVGLLGGSGVAWSAVSNSPTSTLYGLRNSVVVCTTASTSSGGGIAYGPGGSTLTPAPGKSYAASGYVYISTTAQRMALTVDWTDAGGATVGTVTGDHVIVPAYAWTRLTAIGVPPAGAVSARLRFASVAGTSHRNWAVNDQVRVDALLLEPSSTIEGYFDGGWAAFPTVPDALYTFLGTPNLSASQETIPDPANIVAPILVLGYDVARPSNNTVHGIIGASAPIVVVGVTGTKRGTLAVLLADAAEKDKLEVLLAAGAKFYLSYPEQPSVQMYFALGEGDVGIRLDSETRARWIVSIPFVEVPA